MIWMIPPPAASTRCRRGPALSCLSPIPLYEIPTTPLKHSQECCLMSSPKVRADYEELKQVVSTFKRAGDATGRSLHAVRREKDVLQGGAWIGQGATAFYKEMDDSVLPTLKRLTSALDSAANT